MSLAQGIIAALGTLGVMSLSAPASAQTRMPVELELVLALDTSTSVDTSEFRLQRDGLSAAFRHPDVIRAIRQAGPAGIAVAIVQWAGRRKQYLAVDWTLLKDGGSATGFARRIDAMPRHSIGLTDIAGAVRFAQEQLLLNRYAGARLTIDVSGDGSSEAGRDAAARDAATAAGITINGLVIRQHDYSLGELANIDLHEHYTRHVVGGPGAFVMTAKNYEDFRISIRRKLVREIVGPVSARRSRNLRVRRQRSRYE